MHTTEKPAISSALLGMTAYQKAQGPRPMRAAVPSKTAKKVRTAAKSSTKAVPPSKVTKEIKMSVLKSLHAQSNAGLVKIRDVSSALDDLLKNG
ncbi:MAG: hypothetical protein HKP51_11400 [Sulfitobacter sp.]|nr:hypothetical protein [Sulfitobacter sp.]